jgi:hypothetical protein
LARFAQRCQAADEAIGFKLNGLKYFGLLVSSQWPFSQFGENNVESRDARDAGQSALGNPELIPESFEVRHSNS